MVRRRTWRLEPLRESRRSFAAFSALSMASVNSGVSEKEQLVSISIKVGKRVRAVSGTPWCRFVWMRRVW